MPTPHVDPRRASRDAPAVLILGARAPVALDHARRFAAQGWRVVAADSIACRITGWSRAVSATVTLPSARSDVDIYARALADAIDRQCIDMVVPTCEEAFYLSHVRARLPAGARIAVADIETMRTLHSKWTFLQVARDAGIDVPDAALVPSIDAARAWAGDSPAVLKPEFSRFGVHVRLHPHGIPRDAAPLPLLGDWVVQRFCAGRELCSYSVADRGRLLAHVAYHPAHRLGASSSYWFGAVDVPAIRDGVASLVARLGYTGQISFDWIEGDDGRVHALECNPRAISGVHLFGERDDLPSALAGTASTCLTPSSDAPRMIAAVMLGAGLPGSARRGDLHAWRRDWRAARDVIATHRDRLPLAGALVDLASYAGLAMRQRCSLREAATRDIEWDGEPMAAS